MSFVNAEVAVLKEPMINSGTAQIECDFEAKQWKDLEQLGSVVLDSTVRETEKAFGQVERTAHAGGHGWSKSVTADADWELMMKVIEDVGSQMMVHRVMQVYEVAAAGD